MISCLKSEVIDLQQQVTKLTQQLSFIMSFVGITDSQPANDPSVNQTAVSYASVASRNMPNIQGPMRDAVLSAMHSDLHLKQSRCKNIVMSGLPQNAKFTDTGLFLELCDVEFSIIPTVVHTKRLGKPVQGRVQPLLVCLQEEEEAKLLLSLAKTLRNSDDVYTANHVFMTSHLTRAERQAAYEARCRRRQQSTARNARSQHRPDGDQDDAKDAEMDVDTAGRAAPAHHTSHISHGATPTARRSAGRHAAAAAAAAAGSGTRSGACALGPAVSATVAANDAQAPVVEANAAGRTSLNVAELRHLLEMAEKADTHSLTVSFAAPTAAAVAVANLSDSASDMLSYNSSVDCARQSTSGLSYFAAPFNPTVPPTSLSASAGVVAPLAAAVATARSSGSEAVQSPP